jgi:DNA mismatch repair protein MutL
VNNRFIKSAYLNHAVMNAFENMIAKDSFPAYVLFIDLDPSQVDINVHPTKQEIKFEDEKIVYAFVQAAVKHALAQFSIAPSLDFSLNAEIQQLDAVSKPLTSEQKEEVTGSSLYKAFTQKHQAHYIEPNEKSDLKHWREYFTPSKQSGESSQQTAISDRQSGGNAKPFESLTAKLSSNQYSTSHIISDAPLFQLHNTYIVVATSNGFMLVHQQLAHERILYDKYSQSAHGKQMTTQKSLFPITMELATPDAVLLEDLLPELSVIGFQIEEFGGNSFVIQGTPADVQQGNEKHSIELLLEQFKHFNSDMKFSKREKLVRCMARQQAIKAGQILGQREMTVLVEELFQCNTPNITPSGNPTYLEFKEDYLVRMFGK